MFNRISTVINPTFLHTSSKTTDLFLPQNREKPTAKCEEEIHIGTINRFLMSFFLEFVLIQVVPTANEGRDSSDRRWIPRLRSRTLFRKVHKERPRTNWTWIFQLFDLAGLSANSVWIPQGCTSPVRNSRRSPIRKRSPLWPVWSKNNWRLSGRKMQ